MKTFIDVKEFETFCIPTGRKYVKVPEFRILDEKGECARKFNAIDNKDDRVYFFFSGALVRGKFTFDSLPTGSYFEYDNVKWRKVHHFSNYQKMTINAISNEDTMTFFSPDTLVDWS